MAAETTPSVTDAEVEALIARAEDAAKRRAELLGQPNGEVAARVAAVLRALLAARREADARVAAAVQKRTDVLHDLLGELPTDQNGKVAWADIANAMDEMLRLTIADQNTLATLLAEAREQGRREMRDMAAQACVEEAALWTTKDIKVGLLLGEEAIRALPVTIPTPEAPQ